MKPTLDKELSLFTKFKITSADTDMFARVRLGGLVNFLIQSAVQSADSLGFGYNGMREHKLFWVLSRMSVQIYKPMKWYEEIVIETWPKDIDRLLYLRDFIVRDEGQNIVARATSGWLALDFESKRPKIVEDLNGKILTQLKNKKAINKLPEKLDPISGESYNVLSANYFDIDLNKHVTATRYIDWMMDTFPVDFHEKNYPKEFSINYLKETVPGENINLKKNHLPDNQFLFEGINQTNNSATFRGKIIF